MSTSTTARRQHLITELQNRGLRLNGPEQEHVSRRGGAGPSDHQAVTIDGVTNAALGSGYSDFAKGHDNDNSG